MREDIFIVREMLSILEYYKNLNPNKENYKNVLNNCRDYLKKNCCHVLVNDLIDIDPDKSEFIRYCNICKVRFI
jgi:hypothetical protein